MKLARESLLDVRLALMHEWALPNGRGGYAAGTALGTNTRSTQGLLVAGTDAGARVLVANVDEEIELSRNHDDGERIQLSTHEYHDDTIQPNGFVHLEGVSIAVDGVKWLWRARGVVIEKHLSILPGFNHVELRYEVLQASYPLRLRVTPFMTERATDVRTRGHHEWRFPTERTPHGVIVRAWEGAMPVGLFARPGRFVDTGHWYWQFLHRADRYEGREHLEDLYTPGLFDFDLAAGESATIVLTAEPTEMLRPVGIKAALRSVAAPSQTTARNRGRVMSAVTAS